MIERDNGQIGDNSHNYLNCSTELHFTVKCDCYTLLYFRQKSARNFQFKSEFFASGW